MAGWLVLLPKAPVSASPNSFEGNPNVTISAINTSGGIVTSRDGDTIYTPGFIQVSASAISATGSTSPYEDLEYTWDFGDPLGTETITRPTDGITVNANNCQTGPEAAYCYRTANPYTITLSIRGKNGGSFTTASATKNITVNTFTPTLTVYADSNVVGGANDGTSQANAFNNLAGFNTAMSSQASNILGLIKRGSHFTGQTGINLNNALVDQSVVRVSDYGAGAKPIIEISSTADIDGGNTAFNIGTGGSSSPVNRNDFVISNMNFQNTGANAGTVTGGKTESDTTHTIKNCYLDTCDISQTYDVCYGNKCTFTASVAAGTNQLVVTAKLSGNFIQGNLTKTNWVTDSFLPAGTAISSQVSGTAGGVGVYNLSNTLASGLSSGTYQSGTVGVPIASWGGQDVNATSNDICEKFGIWKTTNVGPTTSKTIGIGFSGSAKNWHFAFGTYTEGAGTDATLDHHYYPDVKTHGLFSHLSFGPTGPAGTRYQRSYCLNLNWDGLAGVTADHEIAAYTLITDCAFKNAIFAADMGNRSNNTNASDSTVQFDPIIIQRFSMSGGVSGGVYGCGKSLTVRDGRVWGLSGHAYLQSPYGGSQVAGYEQVSHLLTKNYRNKIYVPNSCTGNEGVFNFTDAGWTAKQYITDNIIVDDRNAPANYSLISSDWNTAGSVVNNNTYYIKTAGSTANAFIDNGTGINYTSWKNLTFAPDVSGINSTTNTMGWILPVTQWSDMN